MKRKDKAYISAWILLMVFVPMVVLSSLHVHPQLVIGSEPCHECIDHTVHNGHITVQKATVDCPLCAFQNNVYQGQEAPMLHYSQHVCQLETERAVAQVVVTALPIKPSRAPPYTFCV